MNDYVGPRRLRLDDVDCDWLLKHTWRWKHSADFEALEEDRSETFGEPHCDSVWSATSVEMKPVERDVTMQMCQSVILIHDSATMYKHATIDVDVNMARWHHLPGKACEMKEDFFRS